MKERILITGGSGLLALNWAIAYRNNFDIVLGMHNRIVDLKGVRTEILNLSSVDAISSTLDYIKPDLVINTAGITSVEKCEQDPVHAKKINTTLAGDLSRACAKNDIKLVHISTDHLFEGTKSLYSEEDEIRPLNVYGYTKGLAEKEVMRNNENALIIRTNFYGWGTSYRSSFSDFIIQSLKNGNTINLFDDVYYTPILIASLTRTITILVDKEAKGIYNVVGNERISKYDFGLRLAAVLGLDQSLINKSYLGRTTNLVKRPNDMSLTNRKLCDFLGADQPSVEDDLIMLLEQDFQGLNKEIIEL